MQTIDLNTTEGIITWVKGFTDEQLQALATAPTTIANIVMQSAADGEIILREAGHSHQVPC